MRGKTVPIPVLIFIWLAILGGVLMLWLGRGEEKEETSLIKESGSAALVKPEKESTLSDERKMADLDQIRATLEMYYLEHDKYPISFNSLMPDYFSTNFVFQDKHWMDNRFDTQKYCLWLRLKTGEAYYVASHCGSNQTNRQPMSLDSCCELTKSK